MNPTQIEQAYRSFISDLPKYAHDGVVTIDLGFLYDEGLLDSLGTGDEDTEDLTQYFHVIESNEKVTLFNDHFIVWITPRMEESQPVTYVMIALNHEKEAHLEIVFVTNGVYNSPRYVLKVLQHFLTDMIETEATLTLFEREAE